MLHLCVTTLMANGPGFGFSWVKCNMVLSDAKYTDIGVPLFFVPRIVTSHVKSNHIYTTRATQFLPFFKNKTKLPRISV